MKVTPPIARSSSTSVCTLPMEMWTGCILPDAFMDGGLVGFAGASRATRALTFAFACDQADMARGRVMRYLEGDMPLQAQMSDAQHRNIAEAHALIERMLPKPPTYRERLEPWVKAEQALGNPLGAVAADRLAAARKSGQDNVSLASLGLHSLPPQLAELTNVTALSVGDNRLTSLAPLREMTQLTGLQAYNNQLTSVEDLAGLTKLGVLNLTNNLLMSLSPMVNVTRLAFLDIHANPHRDLSHPPLPPLRGAYVHVGLAAHACAEGWCLGAEHCQALRVRHWL